MSSIYVLQVIMFINILEQFPFETQRHATSTFCLVLSLLNMSIEELGCDELMVGCCVGAGDGWTPDCGLQTPSPAPATSGSVVTRSQTRRRSGSRSSSATLQQITSHHHRLDTPQLHTHHHWCSGKGWTMDRSCRIFNTSAHFASSLSGL